MFKFITKSEAFGLMGTKEHEEYNRTLNEIQSTDIKLKDIIFQYNEEDYNLSVMFTRTGEVIKELRFNLKNSVGRPSLGKTKKVSITMSEDQWGFVDDIVGRNDLTYSKYFRDLVEDDMDLTTKENAEYEKKEEMKRTVVSYCQVCSRDFKNNEIVYYVVIDNSIVCSDCAAEANKLTTDIQPRIYEE